MQGFRIVNLGQKNMSTPNPKQSSPSTQSWRQNTKTWQAQCVGIVPSIMVRYVLASGPGAWSPLSVYWLSHGGHALTRVSEIHEPKQTSRNGCLMEMGWEETRAKLRHNLIGSLGHGRLGISPSHVSCPSRRWMELSEDSFGAPAYPAAKISYNRFWGVIWRFQAPCHTTRQFLDRYLPPLQAIPIQA